MVVGVSFMALASVLPSTVVESLLSEVAALREAADQADWSRCEGASMRAQGLAHASVLRLFGEDARILEHGVGLQKRSSAFVAGLQAAAGTRPEFFAAISARVGEQHSDSLERLAQGETADVPLLKQLKGVASGTTGFWTDRDLVVAASVQGLMGRVHASFNRGLARGRDLGVERLEDAIRRVEATQAGARAGLYSTLIDAAAQPKKLGAAVRLAAASEQALPSFAELQGSVQLRMRTLLEAGKNTEAEVVGQRLARAGLLTRLGVADHTAGYRIALELSAGSERDDVRALLRKASRRAPSVEIPHGRDTALAHVPDEDDGAFIEVWGVVVGLEVQRVGEKLVSRVKLRSPANGAEVDLVVLFAHLGHAGLTRGAFARASGIVRAASRYNDGAPAVEVSRIPLAELAKGSWEAGVVYAARRWFAPWRNGANIMWSIGPHAPGVEGETGAAELKFAPPLREG